VSFNGLHGVASQKIGSSKTTAVVAYTSTLFWRVLGTSFRIMNSDDGDRPQTPDRTANNNGKCPDDWSLKCMNVV
jgi:hypothetical protein